MAQGYLEKFNCRTAEEFVYIMAYLAECKVYKREVHEQIGSRNGEPITITEEIGALIVLQRQKMLDVFVQLMNFTSR